VYVWLNVDQTVSPGDSPHALLGAKDETIRSQQEQIDFLRRELERKDALMLNMTEAMKALTPPPDTPQEVPEEPPEWPESAEGAQYGTAPQEAQESLHDHRPWWQRWFGG
jgi:hypothetical protein